MEVYTKIEFSFVDEVCDSMLLSIDHKIKKIVKMRSTKNWLLLHRVHTKRTRRGCGLGRAMLRHVTQFADASGTNLVLWINPFNGCKLDIEGLRRFYAQYGFHTLTANPRYMVRMAIVPNERIAGYYVPRYRGCN